MLSLLNFRKIVFKFFFPNLFVLDDSTVELAELLIFIEYIIVIISAMF